MKPRVLLGPPGTGKTESIARSIESAMRGGVDPDRILVVSFTRAARDELMRRVGELKYLGTVHGIAFRLLGLRTDEVFDDEAWKEFGDEHGYQFTNRAQSALDDGCWVQVEARTPDDELRLVHDWGRTHGLRGAAAAGACAVNVSTDQFELFERRLGDFKRTKGYVEFHDILTRALHSGVRPDVDLVYVDEAQDLSPIQIELVEMWFRGAKQVFVAGDVDQSVYGFGGADPSWLTRLARTHDARVLGESHRVPMLVHALAQRIIGRNPDRVDVRWSPAPRDGAVLRVRADDVGRWIDGSVETRVLVRNRVFMRGVVKNLFDAGVPFSVEGPGAPSPLSDGRLRVAFAVAEGLREGKAVDAAGLRVLMDYVPTLGDDLVPYGFKARVDEREGDVGFETLRRLLGRGTLISRLRRDGAISVLRVLDAATRAYLQRLVDRHGALPQPVVKVSTIHASKGEQASRVVVATDMSKSTWRSYLTPSGECTENNVFYTAVTRAKDELVLLEPRTRRHFHVPTAGAERGRP